MPREYLAESAPGALDSLPRMFLAFELPAGFERVTFTLEVRGKPNGCVVLKAKAEGPWREKTPSQLNGRNHYEIVNGLGVTRGEFHRLCRLANRKRPHHTRSRDDAVAHGCRIVCELGGC